MSVVSLLRFSPLLSLILSPILSGGVAQVVSGYVYFSLCMALVEVLGFSWFPDFGRSFER